MSRPSLLFTADGDAKTPAPSIFPTTDVSPRSNYMTVGRLALHSSSLSLTKPLRPLEYGFVEFSRQKVRIYPDPTHPHFPIFLTQHSGCNGPVSEALSNLLESDTIVQVVLETYSTHSFLGRGTSFIRKSDLIKAVFNNLPRSHCRVCSSQAGRRSCPRR